MQEYFCQTNVQNGEWKMCGAFSIMIRRKSGTKSPANFVDNDMKDRWSEMVANYSFICGCNKCVFREGSSVGEYQELKILLFITLLWASLTYFERF